MTEFSINIFEDLHHVCLMYGLKQAYRRFPFLVHNIMATPPPFRRNPERTRLFIGSKLNPICVQYYKKSLHLLYDDERVTAEEIHEFGKAVVEEYLRLRHPFMKSSWEERRLVEISTRHQIAEII